MTRNRMYSRGGPQEYPRFTGSEPCAEIGAEVYTHEDPWPSWKDAMFQACMSCPMLEPCGEWAVWRERWGYWAGMSQSEREIARRRRGIVLESPEYTYMHTGRDWAHFYGGQSE